MIGVSRIIGQSTETPMPSPFSSRDKLSASATTPNLATQYGPSPALPTMPANDDVNMMWRSPPCSIIRGRNASTPWIGPHRSTSITQRQSPWVTSEIGLLRRRCPRC